MTRFSNLSKQLIYSTVLWLVLSLSGGVVVAQPNLARGGETSETESDGSLFLAATHGRRQLLRAGHSIRHKRNEIGDYREQRQIQPEGRYWLLAEPFADCAGFDPPTPSRDPPALS